MSAETTTPPTRPAFVRKGLRPLGAREGVARDTFAAHGFQNPQIVLRWREFAGPVLGRLTAPIALSPEGQLTISADPSVAILLQHQTQPLMQRVNLALGGAQIVKVKVVSGKFARPKPARLQKPPTASQRAWTERSVGGVQDPDLRAALAQLALAVASETGAEGAKAPLRTKS